MQLYDKGKIGLKVDINTYLHSFQIPGTFPQPITLHHLLTHTSGLDELPGRRIKNISEQKPLSSFLKNKLVRFIPPGQMTAYSSYGIAVGGVLIEDITGKSYAQYMKENIFSPLKMSHTYVQSVPASEQNNLVKAYEESEGKLVEIPYEIYQTPPVSSIISSLADVGNFMLMHLQKGEFNRQRIFSDTTAALMQTQQETMHPFVPGWAYGWQVNDMNALYILEHGGDIGGFSALMSLLPEKNIGIFIVHHLEGNDLRFDIKKAFLDRYFPFEEANKPVIINNPNTERFAGSYRANIYCHSCSDSVNVQNFEIKVNDDGSIILWSTRWFQSGPLLFVSEVGKRKLGFKVDDNENIIGVSAGSWRVLEKIK